MICLRGPGCLYPLRKHLASADWPTLRASMVNGLIDVSALAWPNRLIRPRDVATRAVLLPMPTTLVPSDCATTAGSVIVCVDHAEKEHGQSWHTRSYKAGASMLQAEPPTPSEQPSKYDLFKQAQA